MIDHENIDGSWWEWEVLGDVRTAVLMIAANLDLDPSSEGFDAARLDAVLAAAAAHCQREKISSYKIKVVPSFD